jgi:hypothetical protein
VDFAYKDVRRPLACIDTGLAFYCMDFTPVWYTLPSSIGGLALVDFNTNSQCQINTHAVLKCLYYDENKKDLVFNEILVHDRLECEVVCYEIWYDQWFLDDRSHSGVMPILINVTFRALVTLLPPAPLFSRVLPATRCPGSSPCFCL